MKRTVALLAAALLAAGIAPATARAAGCVGVRPQSLFGTVESVHPGYFTLRTNSAAGQVNVRTQDAHFVYDGLNLNPGVYAGVYGCMAPNDRAFIGETITLASNAQSYPARFRYTSPDKYVEGTVVETRPGQILIHNNRADEDVWVSTNQTGFARDALVRANGYFIEGDRGFVASSVEAVPNGSSVQGYVREVHPGRILIQTTHEHSYLWVLTNAGGLRPGETILARGYFNPNRQFVASNIQIQ
jgi:hypothetical protein